MCLVTRSRAARPPASAPALAQAAPLDPAQTRIVFLLMMAGFAIGGLVLSSILIHMVPLLTAIGLGTAGTLVATLFGPSQVASRLINMLFGGRLSQALLAVIATLLLAVGLAVLLATAPSLPGIAAFVVLFGLGSGLVSIVGGTLPLEMFGRQGYGSRVGWMSAARQFSSSFAPFLFALMMARTSVPISIATLWVFAVAGVAVFTAICVAARTRPVAAEAA